MIALGEIIAFLGSEVIRVLGDPRDVSVRHLRPVESVDADTLDWIGEARPDRQQIAEGTRARAILCRPEVLYTAALRQAGKVLVQVASPRIAVSLVAGRFFAPRPESGVHPSAVLHPEAVLGDEVCIGPNCSIGRCSIGSGTRIHAGVTVYDDVRIGSGALIHAGAVLGTDGLGCDRRPDGTLVTFCHLGRLVIGDAVEIGANCQIARGALSDTSIGDGCKINGLSFIAHNCRLGKNVLITGNSMLAGSVTVQDDATIYSRVVVREHRTIGRGAVIGMGSVVVTDVPAGETWLGSPARRHEK